MSLAARKLKFQFVFTALFVVFALLVTWLILGDSSPLHDYFIWHTDLPNIWGMSNFIPYLVSAILSGNAHAPSMVIFVLAMIVQWSLIGVFLSIPLSRLFIRSTTVEDELSLLR